MSEVRMTMRLESKENGACTVLYIHVRSIKGKSRSDVH